MNMTILGTDHDLQHSDAGLKERIATLVESAQVSLIGEEYTQNSVAHQVADSRGIRWISIDMTQQERNNAGIGNLDYRRFQYRMKNGLPEEIPIVFVNRVRSPHSC